MNRPSQDEFFRSIGTTGVPQSSPTCASCRFFLKVTDEYDGHRCRRRAPSREGFGITHESCWCGEYDAVDLTCTHCGKTEKGSSEWTSSTNPSVQILQRVWFCSKGHMTDYMLGNRFRAPGEDDGA